MKLTSDLLSKALHIILKMIQTSQTPPPAIMDDEMIKTMLNWAFSLKELVRDLINYGKSHHYTKNKLNNISHVTHMTSPASQ